MIQTTTHRIAIFGPVNAGGVQYIKGQLETEGHETEAISSKNTLEVIKAEVEYLYSASKLSGIIAFGGSRETKIAVELMKLLPIGFPKLLVTLSKEVVNVGACDITILHLPKKTINRKQMNRILANAAKAISQMATGVAPEPLDSAPLIGITNLGATTFAVMKITQCLKGKGYEPVSFHSRTDILKRLLEEGKIAGLIDIAPVEIMLKFSQGVKNVEHRLELVGERGLPQIISPGGLDFMAFGGTKKSIPRKFKDRPSLMHGPNVMLVRTSKDELEYAGRVLAERANRAKGPIAIIIPSKGFSAYDKIGRDFYDPEADRSFVTAVKEKVERQVRVVEVDAHINDPVFAMEVAKIIDDMFTTVNEG